MPKQQQSRKRVATEDYDSTGGFVEDAPRSKKSKSAGKSNSAGDVEVQADDDGNPFWEISGKRRLGVMQYNKNTFINIREYYEKDGKMLPGKKGIALSMEQWNAVLELLPQIENVLSAQGIQVSRPPYDTHANGRTSKSEETVFAHQHVKHQDQEDEAPEKPAQSTSKLDKFKHKPNHEATSDEDNV